LVAAIEADVSRGRRHAGERLPSVRSIAASTGLSPTTVAAALAELRRRGVIVTRDRSGSEIAGAVDASDAPAYLPEGTVDLLHGGPDPSLLPDLGPALATVADRLRTAPASDAYRAAAIEPGLEAWWRERAPVGSSLSVTSGAFDAVERTLTATVRHGDRVAVEDPGYPPALRVLRALGLEAVAMAVDAEGPTVDGLGAALAAGARAVIVTPRGQNPTGAALSERRAGALHRVLRRHREVVLIEDDHLGLLGDDVPTLAGATDRWVLARSVSKALGPDLRLALVAGDPATISTVALRLRAGPGWVSHLLQATVHAVLGAPDTAEVLDRAEHTYRARRAALLDALRERGVGAVGPSGFNVWIPVADETSTCLALADRGYAVAPGAPFRLTSGPGIRVTTARLHVGDAGPLADAIAAAVDTGGRHR
jgi:DNA-binding transcriptional MocR family regulator